MALVRIGKRKENTVQDGIHNECGKAKNRGQNVEVADVPFAVSPRGRDSGNKQKHHNGQNNAAQSVGDWAAIKRRGARIFLRDISP